MLIAMVCVALFWAGYWAGRRKVNTASRCREVHRIRTSFRSPMVLYVDYRG